MKRISRIIVALAMTVALLLGGERRARAQFIVSDPGSLIQMILGYVQDIGIATGSVVDGVGTLTAAAEQYEDLKNKLDNLKMAYTYINGIMRGVEDLAVVISVTEDFARSLEHLEQMKSYLAQYDSAAYFAVVRCVDEFQRLFISLLKDTQELTRVVMNMQRAEPLAFLEQIRKLAVDFSLNYNSLVYSYMAEASSIYYAAQWRRQRQSTARFISYSIY